MCVCVCVCVLVVLAHGGKGFKKRGDFSNQDDYARYIRDNVSVGTMVLCCEGYEEVQLGDVGRVMKVRVWSQRGCGHSVGVEGGCNSGCSYGVGDIRIYNNKCLVWS